MLCGFEPKRSENWNISLTRSSRAFSPLVFSAILSLNLFVSVKRRVSRAKYSRRSDYQSVKRWKKNHVKIAIVGLLARLIAECIKNLELSDSDKVSSGLIRGNSLLITGCIDHSNRPVNANSPKSCKKKKLNEGNNNKPRMKRENFTKSRKYKTTKWLNTQQGTTKQQQQQSSDSRKVREAIRCFCTLVERLMQFSSRPNSPFRVASHQNLSQDVRPGKRESKNNSPLHWIENAPKRFLFSNF